MTQCTCYLPRSQARTARSARSSRARRTRASPRRATACAAGSSKRRFARTSFVSFFLSYARSLMPRGVRGAERSCEAGVLNRRRQIIESCCLVLAAAQSIGDADDDANDAADDATGRPRVPALVVARWPPPPAAAAAVRAPRRRRPPRQQCRRRWRAARRRRRRRGRRRQPDGALRVCRLQGERGEGGGWAPLERWRHARPGAPSFVAPRSGRSVARDDGRPSLRSSGAIQTALCIYLRLCSKKKRIPRCDRGRRTG